MLKSKKCAKFCENQTKGVNGLGSKWGWVVRTKKTITEAAHCTEKVDDVDCRWCIKDGTWNQLKLPKLYQFVHFVIRCSERALAVCKGELSKISFSLRILV